MSTVASGARSAILFKEETTLGVPPTGNWERLSLNSESVGETINTIMTQEVRPDRMLSNVRGGNISVGGDITMDFYSKKLGIFLKHLLGGSITDAAYTIDALVAGAIIRGKVVSSGGQAYTALNAGTVPATPVLVHTGGSVATLGGVDFLHIGAAATALYTHTITGSADLPVGGISFEKHFIANGVDQYFPVAGVRLSQGTFNIPQEGIASLALAVLGRTFAAASNTSIGGVATDVADEGFTGYETALILDGTQQTAINTGSLVVNNNMDANVFVWGSRYRKDVPPLRREIAGNFTMFFEDINNYNRFKNETTSAARLSFIHLNSQVDIFLSNVKFTGGSPTPVIAGNGTVTQQFAMQAFLGASSYDIRVVLTNAVATY